MSGEEPIWICPRCLREIPFPRTVCEGCPGRPPFLAGRGLTSALIAAAVAVGSLIAAIANLPPS